MGSHLSCGDYEPSPGISKTQGMMQPPGSQGAKSKHPPAKAAQLNGQERSPASNAEPCRERTYMNVCKCTQTEGSNVRLAISMSNGLTLEYITDYYCIKNGNDSAILVFSKLLSKPILKFKKKKNLYSIHLPWHYNHQRQRK